jgi:hypothetical protein
LGFDGRRHAAAFRQIVPMFGSFQATSGGV